VDLPAEVEWEKAARGGIIIPERPILVSAENLEEHLLESQRENEYPQRYYPWGDEPDANCGNYKATGIGASSAVGSFPAGASPYGCLDMSGNVWEWMHSDYPPNFDNMSDDENTARRVLRGGAFDFNHHDIRCASRLSCFPNLKGGYIGFRVIVATS
jgi:formylglycine-generating enzyme required for sulfatase activity